MHYLKYKNNKFRLKKYTDSLKQDICNRPIVIRLKIGRPKL